MTNKTQNLNIKIDGGVKKENMSKNGTLKKKMDIIIITPTFETTETIEKVLVAIDKGLKKFYPDKEALIILADSSSRKTQKFMLKICKKINTKVQLISRPPKGKGEALLYAFGVAKKYKPKAVATIDSDLRSIKPEWVYLLLEPVLSEKADFVSPNYLRHKYDGTITNMFVHPICAAVFGHDIRQPIGGDFAFSGALNDFYTKKKDFTREIERFGIDSWLTISAIVKNSCLTQANLGVKIHDASVKHPLFPENSIGKMFYEVAKTNFRLMTIHDKYWLETKGVMPVEYFGEEIQSTPEMVRLNFRPLWKAFKRTAMEYRDFWEKNLSQKQFERIKFLLWVNIENYEFTQDLWVDLVYDFALLYKKAKSLKEREKVVQALAPLYLGRVACFALEAEGMNEFEAEGKVKNLVRIFALKKPGFVRRWKEIDNNSKLKTQKSKLK